MKRKTRSQQTKKSCLDEAGRFLPVYSLIGTNHATAPHERALIEESIEDCYRQIAEADAELAELTEYMNTVSRRRLCIEGLIEDQQKLLLPSPVRTLPAEILSEIFSAHCDLFTKPDLKPRHDPCLYPDSDRVQQFRRSRMLLLRICRRWRQVALSSPRLWTSFHIGLLFGKDPVLDETLSTQWLNAAATVPLNLSYSVDPNEASLRLLITYLPRCTTLQLNVDEHVVIQPHRDAVVDIDLFCRLSSAPVLSTLTLSSDIWGSESVSKWAETLLQNAPMLTSLTTNAPVEVLYPLTGQLLRLHLTSCVSLSTAISYIETLKELRHLEISLLKDDEEPPAEQRCVTHPKLQSLCCRSRADYEYGPFLDSITLPQLHTLTLYPHTFPSTSLRELFTRSACPITALTLHIWWPETRYGEAQDTLEATQVSALVDCLKVEEAHKHLSRLTIIVRQNSSYSHHVIPLPLLKFLTDSPHLPNLTYLRFTASSSQAPLIKQLLMNRVTNYEDNHFVKLEALTLHLSHAERYRSAKPGFDYLQSFRLQGCRCSISTRGPGHQES